MQTASACFINFYTIRGANTCKSASGVAERDQPSFVCLGEYVLPSDRRPFGGCLCDRVIESPRLIAQKADPVRVTCLRKWRLPAPETGHKAYDPDCCIAGVRAIGASYATTSFDEHGMIRAFCRKRVRLLTRSSGPAEWIPIRR